jgi:hypothetical protein
VTAKSTPRAAAPAAGLPAALWPTPRTMRAFQIVVWGLALLLFLAGEGTLGRARGAMKTIGRDSAPSIIAAEEINFALADLDTNAANYLLGHAQHRGEAIATFETRRAQATRRLVDAAQNITYGDAEKQPILTMFQELGHYLELFAEARYRYDIGDLPGAIETYRAATTLMHTKVLAAAVQLDAANRNYMDDVYSEQKRASGGAEGVAVVVGGALLGALVALQLFLFRRTRRVMNPPIVIATILAFAFTADLVHGFGAAREDLRVAKEDAFESIHVLWRARAVAYDAKGDESRYLLDRAMAAMNEAAFVGHVADLTRSPEQEVPDHGLFADELHNITFDGERDAALEMTRSFRRYWNIDRQVRRLEASGQHDRAVQLSIGSGEDEAIVAFDRFDRALVRVEQINRTEFDRVIDDGDGMLRRAEIMDPAFAILIAVLTWFGLRARIKEYDA